MSTQSDWKGTMSRPRSRSPFHSRNSNLHGMQEDGSFDELYHCDLWRESENISKLDDSSHWDNGRSQDQEQVDHWAKFIEAIGRAGKQKSSSVSRYRTREEGQDFEENASQSPRRLNRERLTSHGAEPQRIQSPGRRRKEHFSRGVRSQGKRANRMEHGYNNEHEDRYCERSSHTERSLKSDYRDHQLQPKRFRHQDPPEQYNESHGGFVPHCASAIVEHVRGIPKHDERSRHPSRRQDPVQNREHARVRGPSQNCNPGMNHGPLQFHDLEMNRGPSGSRDPGINQDTSRNRGPGINRGPPRSRNPDMNQEHKRSRSLQRSEAIVLNSERPRSRNFHRRNDLPRNNPKGNKPQIGRELSRKKEPLRNLTPLRHMGERDDHAVMSRNRHDSSTCCYAEEETTDHLSLVGRENSLQSLSQHRKQTRMGSHPRQYHGHVEMELNSDEGLNDDPRSRSSGRGWNKEILSGGNRSTIQEQEKAFKRFNHCGILTYSGGRVDFIEHETLRIKVDRSRPVGQSSHLGYSSERQLSLDLVNVGRQRLDFLPMLEHSGTFKETSMHSGTFAQEIITLLHHVKDVYFQGQGITLNDRFSNKQHYSLVDKEFEEGNRELEDMRPVINRPFVSTSDTQMFCKVGVLQQRRPQAPASGDLRLDLERKRLLKLKAVKITIAGSSQMLLDEQNPEHENMIEEDLCEAGSNCGWSEQVPQPTGEWELPPQKRPAANFNARRNSNRFGNRSGLRRGQNPKINKGARW